MYKSHSQRETASSFFCFKCKYYFYLPQPCSAAIPHLNLLKACPHAVQKQSHSDIPHSLAQPRHTPLPGFSQTHTHSTAVGQWASKAVSVPTLQEREGRCTVILLAHHVSWADFSTSHLLQGGYGSRGLEAQSHNRDYHQLNIELSCEAERRNISVSPFQISPQKRSCKESLPWSYPPRHRSVHSKLS